MGEALWTPPLYKWGDGDMVTAVTSQQVQTQGLEPISPTPPVPLLTTLHLTPAECSSS